jgi:hypothetical protein
MWKQQKATVQISDDGRKAIAEVVKKELTALLAEEGDLTSKRLAKMRRIIDGSEPMLRVGLPERKRNGMGGIAVPNYAGPMEDNVGVYSTGAIGDIEQGMGDSPDDYGLGMDQQAMVGSSLQETFGAKMMRELVAAIPKLLRPAPTLTDLVTAAAAAKDAGLTTVLKDIEEKIAARIEPPKDEPSPPTEAQQPGVAKVAYSQDPQEETSP